MPRILDLEIGAGWLILRVLGGLILSAATFFILSYVPSHIPEFVSGFVPPAFYDVVIPIISGVIHPLLYIVGIFIAVLVFLEVLLRKTRVYGPILIIAGLISTVYVYLALHGGVLTLVVPEEFTMGLQVNVRLYIVTILILAMIPCVLTAVKGAIITIKHRRQN